MDVPRGELQTRSTKRKVQTNVNDDGEKCPHPVIMKDMCCKCGKNLRPEGGFSGERIEPTVASVSMIHHVPELVVSKEIAHELGAKDHENILKQRKLILLLDLDQTLVHTSNRPLKPNEVGASDLIAYRLGPCTFYTKIRPHTRHLLERLNKFYEMHIVTFGQRMYAHKIAELLDPDKTYFDYRVLSRDELLSSMHKTGNLKALFPCSEQLIVMLDDRADVWMHSDALIRVKPYRFFTEVGDINAPPQEFMDAPRDVEIPKNSEAEADSKQAKEKEHNADTNLADEKKAKDGENEPQPSGEGNDAAEAPNPEDPAEKVDNRRPEDNNDLTAPIPPLVDDDNALEHIERVLIEIHSLFYQHFDKEKKLPDVMRIVGWYRSQVLAGERIVFSGIIPLGVDVRASEIYRLCCQYGAKVDDRIVEKKTTVLVAARAATEKFRMARRLHIPIVSTRWLDACFERWQRVDKRDFLFREEDDEFPMPSASCPTANRSARLGEGKRRMTMDATELSKHGAETEPGAVKRQRLSSASLCLDEKMDHFAQMEMLSKTALHEMEDEVDNALSEEDEDGDGDPDNKESSSSSAGSYSGDEDGEEGQLAVGGNRHDKSWEDEYDGSAERLAEEGEAEFSGAPAQGDDNDEWEGEEESKEFTDYGDEDTTRDAELDEENEYDEMANDIEEQLNNGNAADKEDDDG